jgi:hypothetical protein
VVDIEGATGLGLGEEGTCPDYPGKASSGRSGTDEEVSCA